MKKRSFKWLRRIGIGLGVIVCGALIVYFIFNEKMPKGETGVKAEALATKIQAAVNIEAWDTTEAVQWTFKDAHTFLWDKKRHWVKVNWKNNEALIRIDSVDGRVWEDGKEYPLVKLEISSASHPFFTGEMKLIDTAGRIEKFKKKYARFKKK